MNNVMAGQTKEQSNVWQTKLIIEDLKIAAVTEPANTSVIGGKIKMVEMTFVKGAHSQYCHKAKIGLGPTDSLTYKLYWQGSSMGVSWTCWGRGRTSW